MPLSTFMVKMGCPTSKLGITEPRPMTKLLIQSSIMIFSSGQDNIATENKSVLFIQMSMLDIASKSLVVAFWDEDSNSKDDYMAGVTYFVKQEQI